MNIVRENLENLTSLLKVTVSEPDYKEAVEKALREYKRRANVPGFRPGMVPMGIIRKMYGKGVVAEESYRAASKAAFDYLEKEKIDIVGDMLPSDLQKPLDFENETDYEFVFEVGIAPEVKISLDKNDKVEKYSIIIDDKMREGYRSNFLRRFGKLVDVETIEKDEAVNVTLEQEGLKVEDAYVGLINMTDEQRAPFIGKKVGDVMDVDVNELYPTPSQRAAILSVKEEELEGMDPKFKLTIVKIRKFAEPELNEEFFKMAFPDGSITDEKAFDAYIENQIAKDLYRESEYMFTLDMQKFLLGKANLKLPEEFLKQWLFTINEGKFKMEDIERDFGQFLDMMKWNLVQKHFIKEFSLEVTPEEANEEAKALALQQFAYYGMNQVAEDMLANYAKTILENKDENRKIYEKLFERKVVEAVTPLITVTEKSVSAEEFGKLVEEVQKK